MIKYDFPFEFIFDFFFVIKFQNCGNKLRDHEILWMKNLPMRGVHTNKKIE
jgi:hypothetical protein